MVIVWLLYICVWVVFFCICFNVLDREVYDFIEFFVDFVFGYFVFVGELKGIGQVLVVVCVKVFDSYIWKFD